MPTRYKLAEVTFEKERRAYEVPSLYYTANVSIETSSTHSMKMLGAGMFDATTFMNALSVQKWQRYTYAEKFFLHLELRCSCDDMVGKDVVNNESASDCTHGARIVPTYAQLFDSEPCERTSQEVYVSASSEWQSFDIELDVSDDPILVGFRLYATSALELRQAYYYTEVDNACISTPELALCTTTFKKEPFVIRNAHRVRDHILASDDPIADHFTMHIVDNGRTLHAEDVVSPGILLHPNPNAGGSGGYARGMIEARHQSRRATHVLLMDDDVEVCPESIIRTYHLLALLRPEYQDAFISGAMMCLEDPSIRWEDVGHMNRNGQCLSLKSPCSMALFENVVRNEVVCSEQSLASIAETQDQYAGWWYCAIPMQTIDKVGLPLPLFVRFDDIEYSLRARPQFISMNGIAVWHMGFNSKYSAAVERYQTTRNSFITQCTTNISSLESLLVRFKSLACELDLRKFNYEDAALALEGFEDFMKGPEFIMKKGQVEERFMHANRAAEKLLPRDEFEQELEKHGMQEILQAYGSAYLTKFEETFDTPRSFKQRFIDFITFNGQRYRWLTHTNTTPAVIDHAGWLYQAGLISQRQELVVINRFDGSGTIRTRDSKRFGELHERLKRDLAQFAKAKDTLQERYKNAFSHMVSEEFWVDYLGMND